MRIRLFLLVVFMGMLAMPAFGADNADTYADLNADPKANPKAVVVSGKARFTVLTPEMIRIQYSDKGLFEDRATFAVINRRLPVPRFSKTVKDGWLQIKTSALTLRYRIGSKLTDKSGSDILTISLKLNGSAVEWHPSLPPTGNLKGTTRTLDNQRGDNKRKNLENGVLSRDGWAVIDESPLHKRGDGSTTFAFDKSVDGIPWWAEPVDKQAVDWYFMGYGHEYKKALADFTKVAGRIPMPPLYILGYWYSRYHRYTQQEFMDLADEIQGKKIPIDVMIFDKDWHTAGWTGWTWDKSIIPEPEKLIKYMHDRGIKVALNLHPADGIDADEEYFDEVERHLASATPGGSAVSKAKDGTKIVPWQLTDSTFYRALFNDILRKREAQGVDFWWIDWQQNLTSKFVKGLGETFWCNHVFYNDMKQHRTDRRPVIYHRWGGLGCHRYPIGFSGDTHSTFPTLAFQPYFTATASNVGFDYWGHDLGGHTADKDNSPERFLRWMQFGVFTPIFRTHPTIDKNSPHIERRIWKYPNFEQLLATVYLRYTLMPYIYNAARAAYDTGVGLCRPLYYEWPEHDEAYSREFEDEYMFGNDMLVAPIVEPAGADKLSHKKVWLPDGIWFDVCRGKLVRGGMTFEGTYTLDNIPCFVRAGAIIPCFPRIYNLKSRPDTLILKAVPGADGRLSYYEDANDDNGYQQGEYTITPILQKSNHASTTLTIKPRRGSFKSMPAERHYKVQFLATAKPTSATVNGKPAACAYDEKARTATVVIRHASFDKSYKVRLKVKN